MRRAAMPECRFRAVRRRKRTLANRYRQMDRNKAEIETADQVSLDLLRDAIPEFQPAEMDIFVACWRGSWSPFLSRKGEEICALVRASPNIDRWKVERGQVKVLPDGALECVAGEGGFLLFPQRTVGASFEMAGDFEYVSTTDQSCQAGVVCGRLEVADSAWLSFRFRRGKSGAEGVTISKRFTKADATAKIKAAPPGMRRRFHIVCQENAVDLSLDGQPVFTRQPIPPTSLDAAAQAGFGAYNEGGTFTIRYREVFVRKLLPQATGDGSSR